MGYGAFGVGSNRVGLHYGADYTTGFGTYRDNKGDWLLVLTNNAIYSVQLDPTDDFRITDAIGTGCVSQRAFVSLGIDSGDAVYLSQFGIHSLRQSQQYGAKEDKFLSWKIRQTMKTLNISRLKYAVGAHDSQNGRVVFAVPTGSSTSNDTLLVLDTKGSNSLNADNAKWYIWRISGVSINELLYARDASDNWHLYAGTTTGDVLRFSDDAFNDLDAAYQSELQTAHNDLGSLLIRKTLGPIMVTLQPGGNYRPTMKFIFDYGQNISTSRQLSMKAPGGSLLGVGLLGGFMLGTAEVTRNEKVYGAGSGRTIGFNISHTGADEPYRVGKIDYLVAGMGQDAGDAAA